ncbi:ABC transporter permease [Flavobacterium sp. GT3R68]|uniref:ABC transporter permease n=1 Tax=Flavobacterium sp. GT3R68 TaxID=2594437 RepID=UPI000F886039|nr:ABC transporter permease [Flavobacterium sp. GT3R68]RTY93921.1 ABC transporter permease [Flavobacterium sp. GSN2]TRW93464.1 ABC transporter permease [Flavobacterium sp. GT3R68]
MEQYENTIAIQNYLPHRAPMLLVDVIVELNERVVKTIFEIKESTLFVENNVFAEVGLIENAAQTCSAIVGKSYYTDENNQEKENVNLIGFISGIKKLKIHQLPKVGQVIKTTATLDSRFDSDDYSICTMVCMIFDNEAVLFEAEINLFIQETK